MSCTSVKLISECFIKPLDDLTQEAKQPIHFTPFEAPYFNLQYSQKGLLFAKPPPENQDFSVTTFLNDLQRSLSATLTHFYPLASRFSTRKQDNPPSYVIYIDPENAPGAKFIYAKADATVSDIINPPDVPLLVRDFFDLNKAIAHDAHTLPVLSIQVTELVDGIFIAGSVNHLIADGTSFWHFMNTWSEIFRSGGEYDHGSISRPPVLKRWVLDGYDHVISIPYTHHDQFIERLEIPLLKERFFSFSSTAVSKLKEKANSECNTHNISGLQAVVALLWRCITRARCLPHDRDTSCSLMVSTRRRLNPPLPDEYFGSPVQTVGVKVTVGDLMAHGLGWAAFRLHEAVISHDDKAIKETVESWLRSRVVYKLSQLAEANGVLAGSSPRFDMYGCEFELGKAVAVRSGCMNKRDGKIEMYPGRLDAGGSMDVEVCLSPEYMKNIELDEELISALESSLTMRKEIICTLLSKTKINKYFVWCTGVDAWI